MIETAALLARSHLFAALRDGERADLARRMVRREHEAGDYLFFEGDPAGWLLFVAEGRVKMIKHSESGRETILSTFGPGEVVGEVGVLAGEVYPATAQALERTITLALQRDQYAELVQSHPELAWALIVELGSRLQRAHEKIRSFAVEKVERRVARALLRMAHTSGERLEGGAVRITVPLTRQDIADMAGTVVETAIRTVSKFQKQGLVDTQGGHIVLLNPHALVAIAEEL
ncbi:MAG: Crp/Fnr family transcriptional regulator [Anaerolineae bacterium]|nr:Crp/Fnr family transcriptional regulator [Anaerolineae bacterium]